MSTSGMNRLMIAVSFLAMSTSSKNLTPVLDFFSREFTPKAGFETYTGEEAACVLDKAVHTGEVCFSMQLCGLVTHHARAAHLTKCKMRQLENNRTKRTKYDCDEMFLADLQLGLREYVQFNWLFANTALTAGRFECVQVLHWHAPFHALDNNGGGSTKLPGND